MAGSEPSANARVIEAILDGGGPKAARAAIVLNAGAAIYVSGRVNSYGEGVAAAKKAIEDIVAAAKAALEGQIDALWAKYKLYVFAAGGAALYALHLSNE